MNQLLKEHGYLYGEPGAYGLTDKGKRFGQEQYNENGYGGSAHRSWETRTWNDDLPTALRADMGADPDGFVAKGPIDTDDGDDCQDCAFVDFDDDDDTGPGPGLEDLAILGAIVVLGYLTVRYGPSLWRHKIKPAAKRLMDGPEKRDPGVGSEVPE